MAEQEKPKSPEFRYVLAARLLVGMIGTWQGNDTTTIMNTAFELADAFIDRMYVEETGEPKLKKDE